MPGFPSIMDYPADYSHSGRATQCEKLAAARTSTARTDRSRTPRLFFAGVVQTKSHGPGLYEASRLVLYSCWKNRSSEHGFSITQTENVLVSVNQWEVEPPVDAFALTRQASTCVVPEGKIGSYGHRAVPALLLGCVPVLTKERHSHGHFDEARGAQHGGVCVGWGLLCVLGAGGGGGGGGWGARGGGGGGGGGAGGGGVESGWAF